MKQLFFATLLLLVGLTACKKDKIAPPAQEDAFIKYYGHIGSQYVNDMAVTFDGGYILVGRSNSYFDVNIDYAYVVKTDSLGNEVWSITLPETAVGGFREEGKVVVPLTSGDGYIIGCDRISLSGNEQSRMIIYQVDLDGNLVWEVEKPLDLSNTDITGVYSHNSQIPSEKISDIIELPEGNLLVFGETSNVTTSSKPYSSEEAKKLDVSDVVHFKVSLAGQLVSNTEIVRGSTGEDKAVEVEYVTSGQKIILTSTFQDVEVIQGQTTLKRFVNIAGFNNNGISNTEDWAYTYQLPSSEMIATGSTLDTVSLPVNIELAVLGYVEKTALSNPYEGDIFLAKLEVGQNGNRIPGPDNITYYGSFSDNMNGVTDRLIASGVEVVPSTTQGVAASYIVTATHASGTGGEAMLAEIAAADTLVWNEVQFFGLSTSQPENTAGKVVPIVGQVAGTTLTEVDGYVFTGNFNVGTNPMIGLIRTNNQGLLVSRPAEEN